MTKRAYISCPLEAALAAKNFDMKISVKDDSDNEYPWVDLGREDFNSFLEDTKFYIALGSLPLLEPIKYDVVTATHKRIVQMVSSFDDDGFGLYCKVDRPYSDEPDSLKYEDIVAIIQRNGKPFPKIEWEESDDR